MSVVVSLIFRFTFAIEFADQIDFCLTSNLLEF